MIKKTLLLLTFLVSAVTGTWATEVSVLGSLGTNQYYNIGTGTIFTTSYSSSDWFLLGFTSGGTTYYVYYSGDKTSTTKSETNWACTAASDLNLTSDNYWRYAFNMQSRRIGICLGTSINTTSSSWGNGRYIYINGTSLESYYQNGGTLSANTNGYLTNNTYYVAGSSTGLSSVSSSSSATQFTIYPLTIETNSSGTTLFETTNCSTPPYYRIPSIVKANNGTLIALADERPVAGDVGYTSASHSIVYKTSTDNGQTWSTKGYAAQANSSSTGFDYCFSDPATVADRESNNILLISGAGKVKYNASSATNFIKSAITKGTVASDGTVTWGTPTEFTSKMQAITSGLTQAFVASGRLCQSKIYKKNSYYRVYAAMITNLGSIAIYSDDFGDTWKMLGTVPGLSSSSCSGVDEPKCEELPDGRVLISGRVGGGRWFNIYTFTELASGTGSWGTPVKSSTVTGGISALGTSKGTNGDVLIVPVKKSDDTQCYLALAGLPAGSGDSDIAQQRCNLKIYYKELANDLSDLYTTTAFASNWDGSYQVSSTTSAYSSMDLDANGDVAFFYEENLLKNDGSSATVNTSYEEVGYDMQFQSLSIADITSNAYTYDASPDCETFLKTYFTNVENAQSTWTDGNKTVFTKLVNAITTPTAAQMDAIYSFIANPYETGTDKYTINYVDASNSSTIFATETKSVEEGADAPTADTKTWFGWSQGTQTVNEKVITVPMTNILAGHTYKIYTLASDGTKCYMYLSDETYGATSDSKTPLRLTTADDAATFTFESQDNGTIGTYGATWALNDGTNYLGADKWNSTCVSSAYAWTVIGSISDGIYFYQPGNSGGAGYIGTETENAASTSYTRIFTNKTYSGANPAGSSESYALKFYLEPVNYILDATIDYGVTGMTLFYPGTNDVTFKRAFTEGQWTTLVLPFDVTLSKLKNTFTYADDCELAHITSMDLDGGKIYYTTQSNIEANVPVLARIKPNDDNLYTFEDVTVVNPTDDQLIHTATTGVQLVPVYKKTNYTAYNDIQYNLWFLYGGKFYDWTYLEYMNPFQAYIYNTEKWKGGAKSFTFVPEGDVETSISGAVISMPEGSTNNAIYNIAGQRVNSNAKGLLIKNGKKIFVK